MRDIFYFLTEHDIIEPDDLGRNLVLVQETPWVGEFSLKWQPTSEMMSYWVGKTLMDLHNRCYPNIPGEPPTPYRPQFEVIRKLYA